MPPFYASPPIPTLPIFLFLLFPILLLLLLLPAAFTAAFTATNTIHFPDFQHYNLRQPPPQPQSNLINTNSINTERKLRLNLLHRDQLIHHHSNTTIQKLLHSRIRRDRHRVAALLRRLNSTNQELYSSYDDNDEHPLEFGTEVVSGMEQGSGEYFVRIGVGSPPTSQYMVVDSGSDIVWVQCKPCSQCYTQSDPLFDPAFSASFSSVSCSSTACDRLAAGNTAASCGSGRCRYEVSYGDGSYTKGTLALETITFHDSAVVHDVAIGCGHSNRGMFVGAAGLLGLGGGSMSFVGQLGGQAGGAFTYCLVSRGSSSGSGSLEFGRGSVPVGAAWIPLIRNPRAPSFYYVGLSGLGVGGVRVPIPEEAFRLTELGDGGVVMDTGTAVTRLPGDAYVAFRDAFVAQTRDLPRSASGGVSIFDTCYDLNGFVTVRVPTVSFYFSEGPVLTLPAKNFLIPVDESGTFCLAFAASASRLSIIGNVQQQGIQISVDGANGFVGFGPNVC